MRDRLQQGILAQVDEAGVNGDGAHRVPEHHEYSLRPHRGEAMVIALDLRDWRFRPAQLVRRARLKPRTCCSAMGLRPDQARASIRFSLGKQTVDEDIDFALALVPETVARLREFSPVYKSAGS